MKLFFLKTTLGAAFALACMGGVAAQGAAKTEAITTDAPAAATATQETANGEAGKGKTDAPSAIRVALPTTLPYRVTPENVKGFRDGEFDLRNNKVTMFGKGADGCTLVGTPIVHEYTDTLTIRTTPPENDNMSCRTTFEMKPNIAGKFEGTFKGGAVWGTVKQR